MLRIEKRCKACLIVLLLGGLVPVKSTLAAGIEDCATLEDAAQRLSCYDTRHPPSKPDPQGNGDNETAVSVAVAPPQEIDTAVPQPVVPPAERREEPCDTHLGSVRPMLRSPLAWRWDLDRCEKITSIFLPHRPNYVLPLAFDSSRNHDSYAQQDADERNDHGFKQAEAKFQLSFKLRLVRDLFWGNGDLWGAYTQRSFWQVYSRKVSSPFRESNYEPELILALRTPYELGPLHGRYLNIAFNHQSNGRSDVLSRSWNRVYAEAGLDGDSYMFYIRPWWRISDDEKSDDNPGIENWIGRIEMAGAWQWRKHVFAATVRNNLRLHNNRGSVQLGWSYPLNDRIKSYVQYFTGYGESLIDYQHRANSIGVGIMLGDWL